MKITNKALIFVVVCIKVVVILLMVFATSKTENLINKDADLPVNNSTMLNEFRKHKPDSLGSIRQ